MAKRYRLHLGDGTILVVDRDSLNTWLVDPQATVQIEGSKQWLPLRGFLAALREAEFRASPRRTAKTREELPLIPPPPKKSDREAAPPEPQKPASPPPEPAPVEPPPPPREEPSPWAQPTPPPAMPPPREEPTPWTPPTPEPPPSDEPPPWAQPTPPPPPRDEPVLRKPRPTPARFAGTPVGEPPGVEPLAAGPAAAPLKPRSRPPTRPDDSIQPIPLVPLDETPATRAIPLAQEPARPSPRADADVFSAEAEARGEADTYGQDLPVIPLKPLAEEERVRPPKWLADETPADDLDEAEPAGADLRHADVVFLRLMGVVGGFLSRLLGAAVRYERVQRSRRAAARASVSPRSAETAGRAERPRPSEPSRTSPLSQAARAWQSLSERLAAVVARIGAWRQTKSSEPQSLGQLLASAVPRPTHRPKPESKVASKAEPAAPTFDETFEEPPVADEPPRSASAAPETVRPSRPRGPLPSALKPPPALHELPVLRLAEIPKAEEETAGDVYEDDYEFPGESRTAGVLFGLWRWATRAVVVALLVGGGTWAVFTWRTWFPRAGQVGERALSTIDQKVRSLETEKVQQQILQAAIEQLPQLAPETIQLLLSSSVYGAPDALQLFLAANNAAERGAAVLTPAEGAELAALREALSNELPPAERDRLQEYERARAFGLVLPSEDSAALGLVARGARSLAPEQLARLRLLLGKAIAAGLAPPSPEATP